MLLMMDLKCNIKDENRLMFILSTIILFKLAGLKQQLKQRNQVVKNSSKQTLSFLRSLKRKN